MVNFYIAYLGDEFSDDRSVVTDIFLFSKPIDTYQYLMASSCHPGYTKRNIAYTQALRICRIARIWIWQKCDVHSLSSTLLAEGIVKVTLDVGFGKLLHCSRIEYQMILLILYLSKLFRHLCAQIRVRKVPPESDFFKSTFTTSALTSSNWLSPRSPRFFWYSAEILFSSPSFRQAEIGGTRSSNRYFSSITWYA